VIRLRRAGTLLILALFVAPLLLVTAIQARPADKPAGQPIPNTYPAPAGTPGAVLAVPDEGPLVAPGPAPDLIFDFTSRVVGFIEPCG
jgi:hypothetical protein